MADPVAVVDRTTPYEARVLLVPAVIVAVGVMRTQHAVLLEVSAIVTLDVASTGPPEPSFSAATIWLVELPSAPIVPGLAVRISCTAAVAVGIGVGVGVEVGVGVGA